MIVGGKGRKDVQFYGLDVAQPLGDCDSFADAPFETHQAIGLRDSNGKPMVCGGSKNPNQKSCYVYEIANNTWTQGPNLKRKRVAASTTCLDDGVCWVFGGLRFVLCIF